MRNSDKSRATIRKNLLLVTLFGFSRKCARFRRKYGKRVSAKRRLFPFFPPQAGRGREIARLVNRRRFVHLLNQAPPRKTPRWLRKKEQIDCHQRRNVLLIIGLEAKKVRRDCLLAFGGVFVFPNHYVFIRRIV